MSEQSATEKPSEEAQSEHKITEQDKSSKQGETNFVFFVPHETSKSVPVEKPNRKQQSLEKSNSRQRSREKPQKHSKASKNGDDQHSYKNEKHEKHQRHDRDRQRDRDRDRDRDRNKKSHKNHQQEANNDPFVKQEAYRKTKLCPQLERGQCRKGSECNFAHSQAQLRGLPDFRKTKLCIAFKQGKCGKLSSECKYAHGEAELKKAHKFSEKKDHKKPSRSPIKRQKHHHSQSSSHGMKPQQPMLYQPTPPPPPGYMGYVNPYQSYMNHYVPGPSQPPQSQYLMQRPPIGQYPPPPNRVFNEYSSPPQPNSGQNVGNYGAFGSTGGFYPPPPPPSAYDYYNPYSMPPPPPPLGYNYPPGPKPPM